MVKGDGFFAPEGSEQEAAARQRAGGGTDAVHAKG